MLHYQKRHRASTCSITKNGIKLVHAPLPKKASSTSSLQHHNEQVGVRTKDTFSRVLVQVPVPVFLNLHHFKVASTVILSCILPLPILILAGNGRFPRFQLMCDGPTN